jgi:hypothetical protein
MQKPQRNKGEMEMVEKWFDLFNFETTGNPFKIFQNKPTDLKSSNCLLICLKTDKTKNLILFTFLICKNYVEFPKHPYLFL